MSDFKLRQTGNEVQQALDAMPEVAIALKVYAAGGYNMNACLKDGVYVGCTLGRPAGSVEGETYTLQVVSGGKSGETYGGKEYEYVLQTCVSTKNKNHVFCRVLKTIDKDVPEPPVTVYEDWVQGIEAAGGVLRSEFTQAIADERNRAQQAERANANAIATEKNRAEAAEQINAEAIAAEKNRAQTVEQGLAEDISDEAARAKTAEQANANAIAAEKTRAEGSETNLQALIQQVSASLVNYYLKTETYSKTEVNAIVDGIKQFRYEVAATLPEASAETVGIIYLVPATDPKEKNTKEEFITILEGATYRWEHIGDTNIDLSGYSTTEQMNAAINSALAAYYTKAQTDALIATINAAIADRYTKAETDALIAGAKEHAEEKVAELQGELEDGTVVPDSARNLQSWKEEDVTVTNNFDATVRTAAGTDTIDTEKGAVLLSISPLTDFRCTALRATAENQLRLASNGGGAVAVGTGYYFLAPKLTLGTFGTMEENNGLILVGPNGENITSATVRYKAMADGVPNSVSDGVEAVSQVVTYQGHSYKVYTTPGAGYIIISGITWAETCARIAWEYWYNKFVSPTDPDDVGGTINTAPLFAAAPNGTGKFLVLGRSKTHAERVNAASWIVIDPIGRIAEPSWVTTEVVDPDTQATSYLHTLVIPDLAVGGAAEIEGSSQSLSTDGTSVSYSDGNADVIAGTVRYEKGVPVTATVNLASGYRVNDVGVEIKEGAEGEAVFVCEYSQNTADVVSNATPMLATLRTDIAAISVGSAACTTGTYDAAKEVNIPHFMLLTGGIINVLFISPVNTEHTTLSVSGTGALPIRILGQSLPAGYIKAETQVQMVYDGQAWNITQVFHPEGIIPEGILVDMGLPSGTLWASRDIDLTKPGGFCETPYVYEKSFFSWGNIDGHNPISASAFDYNWGSFNAAEPWYDGQPYGSTKGNTLTGDMPSTEEFDPARANLGDTWATPSNAQNAELFANIRYINADGTEVDTTKSDKRVRVNGILGLYLESKNNGNRLFFACSGYGAGRSWDRRGAYGYFWSSTWFSARYARAQIFYSGGVSPQNASSRYNGFPVRPVQKLS